MWLAPSAHCCGVSYVPAPLLRRNSSTSMCPPLAAWCSADLPLSSVMWIRWGFAWCSFSTSSRRPFTAAYNIQHEQCVYLKLLVIGGLRGRLRARPPSLETKFFLILYGFFVGFFGKIWQTRFKAAPHWVGPIQIGDNLICNSCNHRWSSEKKTNLLWAFGSSHGQTLYSHCGD